MSEQTNVTAPATAGDIMRSPLTTVEQNDHVAAAAYLMKHAGATAITVLDPRSGEPAGIITEADVAHAVAMIVTQAPQSFASEILLRPTQKP